MSLTIEKAKGLVCPIMTQGSTIFCITDRCLAWIQTGETYHDIEFDRGFCLLIHKLAMGRGVVDK